MNKLFLMDLVDDGVLLPQELLNLPTTDSHTQLIVKHAVLRLFDFVL